MDVGLVCDGCDTFNPMGQKTCARCGVPLGLTAARTTERAHQVGPGSSQFDPEVARPSAQQPAAPIRPSGTRPKAAPLACSACGAQVPLNYKFCGVCGQPVPPEPHATGTGKKDKRTLFFGAMQAARAKLVLIKGDGLDGVSFTLAGQDHLAGRVDVPLLFEGDPFLSPTHANFFYREGQLVVRDENSLNGVFMRIRGAHPVVPGDRFLVGEQVLELQHTIGDTDGLEPTEDGTYFFASPRRAARFRIVQRLRGGETGLAFRAQSDLVSIGRDGNDINFPDDPFISGHHARVEYAGGKLQLTDLGSKNGTFLRVNLEVPLAHGDYVFMGQQLLRVEIV